MRGFYRPERIGREVRLLMSLGAVAIAGVYARYQGLNDVGVAEVIGGGFILAMLGVARPADTPREQWQWSGAGLLQLTLVYTFGVPGVIACVAEICGEWGPYRYEVRRGFQARLNLKDVIRSNLTTAAAYFFDTRFAVMSVLMSGIAAWAAYLFGITHLPGRGGIEAAGALGGATEWIISKYHVRMYFSQSNVLRGPRRAPWLIVVSMGFGWMAAEVAALGHGELPLLAAALVALLSVLIEGMVIMAWRGVDRLERENMAMFYRTITAGELERRQLSSTIHNGPLADLDGVNYELSAEARRLRRAIDADGSAIFWAAVGRIVPVIDTLRELRATIAAGGTSSGLEADLEVLLEPLRKAGVEVELEVQTLPTLPESTVKLVNGVALEALRNVSLHSHATKVKVRLAAGPTRREVTLAITDNGNGFSTEELSVRQQAGHRGLTLLRAMVEDEGAKLQVESSPGEGTEIRLVVRVPERPFIRVQG